MFAVACGPVDQSGGTGAAGGSDAGVSDSGVGGPPIDVRIVSPTDGEKCEADAHGNCAGRSDKRSTVKTVSSPTAAST